MLHVMFNTVFEMLGLSLRKQATSSASFTFLQDLYDSSLSIWPKNNVELGAKGNIPDLLAQSTFFPADILHCFIVWLFIFISFQN